MNRSEFLTTWIQETGVPVRRLAADARLSERTVAAIADGSHDPSVDEIESLARVLGLRGEDLYGEQVSASGPNDAVKMLLKSAEDFHPGPEVRLRMLTAARAALDLMELLPRQGRQNRIEPPRHKPSKPPYEQGADLAREVRKKYALKGPIPSLRDFVTQTLGIPIVAAHLQAPNRQAAGLQEAGPDALTVYAPSREPVIVLNLGGKNENGLTRRFSLAHEVYHALFDRPGMGAFGVACQWNPERHLERETKANAFAMRLLLPEADLRKLGDEVLEPAQFRKVMEHWGVHRSALELYVEKLRDMSKAEAERDIPTVDGSCPTRWEDAEELPAERSGLESIPVARRGPFLEAVLSAYRDGKMGLGTVRDALHVDAMFSFDHVRDVLDLPAAGA